MMAFFAQAASSTPPSPATWPQHSLDPPMLLPDGSEFTTWEPAALQFNRTYYVRGSDPRSRHQSRHGGRALCHDPSRGASAPTWRARGGRTRHLPRTHPAGAGGSDPANMISYEAEPGAQVILRGSRVFDGAWTRGEGAQSNVWSARLDEQLFDGYQPFALPNVTEKQFESMDWAQSQRGKVPFTLVRGLVFQDGRRLTQVAELSELASAAGTFWMDRTNQVLHVRFFGDTAPSNSLIELTSSGYDFRPRAVRIGIHSSQGIRRRARGGTISVGTGRRNLHHARSPLDH